MYRPIAPTLLALLLAACATQPRLPDSAPAGAPSEAAEEAQRLDETLLFHVLSGELAGSQGDLRQSLEAYLQAARMSRDPRLAERAARLALYLQDYPATLEAAGRWQQLAPDDPASHEVLAQAALRSGRRDSAMNHLRAVLRLEPAGVGPAFGRVAAVLRREAGADRERALAMMRALVDQHGGESRAHQALGELALQLERPELALAAAERAKALDGDWTAPDLLRVRAYLAQGQGEEAVRLLEWVLQRQPDDYDLRLQYARALLGLERTEPALQQFELLLKTQPDDAQIRYVAALLALELGEHDKARSYLLQLINAGQRTDDAYFYLGRLAQAEGDAKGALRWYRQVQGEHRPDALLRVAALLAQQGQPAAAYAQLQEVRRTYPAHAARSYLLEADLLRQQGRLQDAMSLYERALAQHPEHAELRYGRALTAAMLGRVDDAEQDLRRLLEKDGDDPQVLNALGYTLVDQTPRYQEGFDLIQRAFALRPDDPAIMDSMGWALYRLNRLDEARELLRQAYQRSPESEIAAHLAEVLWRLGERREARQLLNEALRREPAHKVLLNTKKRLQ